MVKVSNPNTGQAPSLEATAALTPVPVPKGFDAFSVQLTVTDPEMRRDLMGLNPDVARTFRNAAALGIRRIDAGSATIRRHDAADAIGEQRAEYASKA